MTQSTRFTIRQFDRNDIEATIGLTGDLGLSHWSDRDYLEELERNDSEMLAVSEGGVLLGFIVGRRIPGELEGEWDAEIYNIGVAKISQRAGIGRMLMLEFFERCHSQNVRRVWLEVRAENPPARAFYKSFGFTEYATRPNFYRDPVDDGIVMCLSLDYGAH